MNKRKLIFTIIIDLIFFAVLALSVYLLMFKDLNEWQKNLATALIVIAFPTIFYSMFTQFATNKYSKLKDKDDKLWDEVEVKKNIEINSEEK